MDKTDTLSERLASITAFEGASIGYVGAQLKMVAKLMKLNAERNVNRDVFLVKQVSGYNVEVYFNIFINHRGFTTLRVTYNDHVQLTLREGMTDTLFPSQLYQVYSLT